LTFDDFKDVYFLATLVDDVAQEARDNERKRIFSMGFFELCREFWKGKQFYAKQDYRGGSTERLR
jgi:hypothetical protein